MAVDVDVLEQIRERLRVSTRVDDERPDGTRAFSELVHDLLGAQREELRRLQERGLVTPEVARRLDHDLDLEEARLERERPA